MYACRDLNKVWFVDGRKANAVLQETLDTLKKAIDCSFSVLESSLNCPSPVGDLRIKKCIKNTVALGAGKLLISITNNMTEFRERLTY